MAELFEQIPEPLRLGRPLALPDGLSEADVFERLSTLAGLNADAEEQVCFVGAGMYDHYVPAIDAITQRSEFLTPYSYQPEISQGGLQVMFEFQTAMSELTGLPASTPASTRARPRSPRPATWRWERPSGGASSSPAACTRTAVFTVVAHVQALIGGAAPEKDRADDMQYVPRLHEFLTDVDVGVGQIH